MTAAMRVAASLTMALGCSASPRTTAPTAPAAPMTVLTVPRELRSSRLVPLHLSAVGDAVTADSRVRLLRADGVPEAFTVTFRPPRACGASDGVVNLLRVDAAAGAPGAAEIVQGAVVLRARSTGAGDVEVYGEYVHGATACEGSPSPGARVPVHATLRVQVSDDPGRPRERCGGAVGSFAGTDTRVPLSLELVDASNESQGFDNLSLLAPFEVRIEADIPAALIQGAALRLPERPGHVRISVPGRADAWTWQWRVPPSEVTDASVRFFIPGNAGTPLDVTEGARLSGGHRKTRGVFFQLRGAAIGDRALCDLPDARWFRLYSETPDVCAVVPVGARRCDECSGPHYGQEAARLVRDGVCTVRIEAPALDHGRGLRRRVSAEFHHVENLFDLLATPDPAQYSQVSDP